MRLPLTKKEGEALVWTLAWIADRLAIEPTDPSDPLFILRAAGHSQPAIAAATERMFEVAYGDWLEGTFSPLEQLILRVCVENTTWINIYRTGEHTRSNTGEIEAALAALRSLAGKLDAFGIEINHIPFD